MRTSRNTVPLHRKATHDWCPVVIAPEPRGLEELWRQAVFARAKACASLDHSTWVRMDISTQNGFLLEAERHVEGWLELNMGGQFAELDGILRDLRIALIYKNLIESPLG